MRPTYESVIEFDGVAKSYGSQVALDDVSFRVPPGIVFALLGENGAGKNDLDQVDPGNVGARSRDGNRLGE